MMRTTLEIDEGLLEDVVSVTEGCSKSRAVNIALHEYLRHVRLQRLLSRQGQLDLETDDSREFRHLDP